MKIFIVSLLFCALSQSLCSGSSQYRARDKRDDHDPEFKTLAKLNTPSINQQMEFGCAPAVAEIILRYLGGTGQTLFDNPSVESHADFQRLIGREMGTYLMDHRMQGGFTYSYEFDREFVLRAGTLPSEFLRALNHYTNRLPNLRNDLYSVTVLVPIEVNEQHFYNIVYNSLINNVPVAFAYRGSAGPMTRMVNGVRTTFNQVFIGSDEQHFILIIGIPSQDETPRRAIDIVYDCWDPVRGNVQIEATQLRFYITPSNRLVSGGGSYLFAYREFGSRLTDARADINTYFPIRNFRYNFPSLDLSVLRNQPNIIIDALWAVNSPYTPSPETSIIAFQALRSDARVRNIAFDHNHHITAEIYTRSDGTAFHGNFVATITPQTYNPNDPIDVNSWPLITDVNIVNHLATETNVINTFLFLNHEYLHSYTLEHFQISEFGNGRATITVVGIPSLRGTVEIRYNEMNSKILPPQFDRFMDENKKRSTA